MSSTANDDEMTILLKQQARTWVSHDPNPTTAAYVQRLIDNNNNNELRRLFPTTGRIAFGTAGLRASMAPGPLHMNDLTVLQAAQGIAVACQREFGDKQRGSVIIGYDHRASAAQFHLSSVRFAVLTALVFRQHATGSSSFFEDVLLLDGYVATPMVPFGIVSSSSQKMQNNITTIGIMITASHNPKQDAGYKVYWNDGCQIRSPTDRQIASCIEENLVPWMDYGTAMAQLQNDHPDDPCCGLSDAVRTQQIVNAYFDAVATSGLVTGQATKLQWNNDSNNNKPPVFCYTAMHGVGYKFAQRIFATFGFLPPCSVPCQQEPDPDFPTVAFPNPEEAGALDLAKAHAETHGCDIVLASDPDADRLAVAERNRTTQQQQWTVFTGDQIGIMLGHWLWQQYSKQQEDDDSSSSVVLAMCASTVSSKMLAEIARVEGFHFEETLTGFKWIGARAAQLHGSPVPDDDDNNGGESVSPKKKKTYKSIFCYEEAIGFCCGSVIFDKDGISAMAVFAELCYSVYNRGLTLEQHMQSLYDKYGEFVSNNGYFILPDDSSVVVPRIFDRITNHGAFDTLLDTPVGGVYDVESVRYLGEPGYDSTQPDNKPTLPCSKSSPMLTIRFRNGCVAQFRASGTEPKFKYYIELKGKPGVSRAAVANDLEEMSNVILEELLQPEKNDLRRAKL